jgi:AraC-like DNA-binding protein
MAVPFRLHVLVLDDDSSVREALAAGLSRQYIVHTATTGDEACKILSAHPFAAIILDVFLAREYGLDLVSRFRSITPAPIVVLTGRSTEDLAIQSLRLQVSDYLKKPVRLPDLLQTLARLTAMPVPSDPVRHALEHLEHNSAELPTTQLLAAHVGLSERHLRRAFAEQTGQSPRSYRSEIRLEEAARLLATTRLTVDRIARRIGYKDRTQLTRGFHRRYGVTPKVYRNRLGP